MKNKLKIISVAVVGLLMAGGLLLAACEPSECVGSGECTVTIAQGTGGLYVDDNAPKSSCGDQATGAWDDNGNYRYTGGCEVQNNMSNINRKFGVHSCDCAG